MQVFSFFQLRTSIKESLPDAPVSVKFYSLEMSYSMPLPDWYKQPGTEMGPQHAATTYHPQVAYQPNPKYHLSDYQWKQVGRHSTIYQHPQHINLPGVFLTSVILTFLAIVPWQILKFHGIRHSQGGLNMGAQDRPDLENQRCVDRKNHLHRSIFLQP